MQQCSAPPLLGQARDAWQADIAGAAAVVRSSFKTVTEDDVLRWRARLHEACAKIESMGASRELTELVTIVGDVSHEMQEWLGYGLTPTEQAQQIVLRRRGISAAPSHRSGSGRKTE